MSKKSFWNELGDVIGTVIFIKYVIPAIVVILGILFIIGIINKGIVSTQVDKEHSIMYTDFKKTIYKIASKNLNTSEFDLQLSDSNSYDVELEYIVKNKEYSTGQYDELLRNEITKVYNEIKDKELVNDTLFGHDENLKYVEVFFSLEYDTGYEVWLGGAQMRYSLDDKWESGYAEAMQETISTQENLDKAKKTLQRRQEK